MAGLSALFARLDGQTPRYPAGAVTAAEHTLWNVAHIRETQFGQGWRQFATAAPGSTNQNNRSTSVPANGLIECACKSCDAFRVKHIDRLNALSCSCLAPLVRTTNVDKRDFACLGELESLRRAQIAFRLIRTTGECEHQYDH